MTTGFGFGDLFDRYLYALPFVTPEGALQNVPVSILAPTLPFVAPRDFLQNHPTPIPAPAFLDLTYPYEPLLACPDLTYPYELFPAFPDLAYPYEIFENPPGILSNQEVETAMNPSFLPYCDPVPSSSSPQIDSPANNTASLRTIYSAPIPSSPAPALGQNAMGHPSNWHKIPQTVYGWGKKRWDYQPSEPILFHVNGRPGVNMGDALRNEFTGLDGRDDPMFQDGVDAFSCRLMFPGYPANRKPQIFTKHWDKDRNPIARSTLAYHIARKLEHYLNSMASSHSIDGSTDKQWEIGKGNMTLDKMFLVQLEHVTKGSYQPEIWVAV